MPKKDSMAKWLAPIDDEKLVLEHAISQNSDDPRALGEGPCGRAHERPLDPRLTTNLEMLKWGSNAYGRWADCEKCALNMLYYPKIGYLGKNKVNDPPEQVRLAIKLLRDKGTIGECDHKMMKTHLTMARAEMMLKKQEAQKAANQHNKNKSATGAEATKPRARSSTTRATTSPAPTRPTPAEQIYIASESDEDELMTVRELREQVRDLQREKKELMKKQTKGEEPGVMPSDRGTIPNGA